MTSSAATTPATIGLLLGSLRQNGNNAGLADWLTKVAQRSLANTTADTAATIQQVFPFPTTTAAADSSHLRYTGPVLDPHIPQAVTASSDYPSPLIQHWSATVRHCAAFILVTPQYNWGVPGELKNALDQLYHEWTGKPVLVVTYGGHGGNRCNEQLRMVMGGGLKMRTVEERVEIVLPREFITGERRVGDGGDDSFLEKYEVSLTRAIDALVGMLQPAAAADGATEAAGRV